MIANQTPWQQARFLVVILVLLVMVWFGLKEGVDGIEDAESVPQRIAATIQVLYGLGAVASLWALFTRGAWLRWALLAWAIALTATGTMAPVAWGGAGWNAAVLGGAATAAVAGLISWGAVAHSRAVAGRLFLLLSIAAVTSLACEPGVRVTYYCAGSSSFVVVIRADTALATVHHSTYRLAPVAADSGSRYSDGERSLWTSGTDATLSLSPAETYTACTSAPHP